MPDSEAANRYPPLKDLVADSQLLEESGLFDATAYRALAGLKKETNATEHYLLEGWRMGIEPVRNFEGTFLYPYFRSVGLNAPPAITYLIFQASGWPTYSTRADVEPMAALICDSELFDAKGYAARVNCAGLDPALHYLIVGEPAGYPPSDRFDPVYYGLRYPDVVQAGISPLVHFLRSGRREGRLPVSPASSLTLDNSRFDPKRETVLLIVHQATRTGPSILAYSVAMRLRDRCNVVALLLAEGELIQDFQRCCAALVGPRNIDLSPIDIDYLARRLATAYDISYAIASTSDTRALFKPLAHAFVPVVALVHEFALRREPKGDFGRAIEWATDIVFPTSGVAASLLADHPELENRPIHILPYGASALPPTSAEVRREQEESLRRAFRPPGTESAFVVLGCGAICFRKGVDLFLSCAAAVVALGLKRPVRFVWIGRRLAPEIDQDYSEYISEQIARSGLDDSVVIVGEVADLEPAYASADLFFLSSRLDALPNVAVDSALHGLPIVCFKNAGGIAELLDTDAATRMGVVPHLDVAAAARVIAKLADDSGAREELAAATRRFANATFDMEHYVACIDELGRGAAANMSQRMKDLATINADPMFDATSFLGDERAPTTREEAIRWFLACSAVRDTGRAPTAYFFYRRPCPGFHPQIYAYENSGHYDTAIINPLAHFIRGGKPDGPWRHDVIELPAFDDGNSLETGLRVALHAHFYYPEIFSDFLVRLKSNRWRCDLLLSTNESGKAEELREATEGYDRGTVTIRVVPNRGRDIAPFLTAFGDELVHDYDVVGHLHGKRSLLAADLVVGETWREFLWQNMLGGLYPMMDAILDRFAADDGLGLVFPDDPHLAAWDRNRNLAADLSRRMGITEALPPFFDFPIGTMFWARPEALKPLFALGLGWDDYPQEPVPNDGTLLHAIERLLPLVARHEGYRYATTHIPGITW